MALIDSEKEWPDVPSWADVQKDACIKQYQTTPKRWSPTPGEEQLNINMHGLHF